MSVPRIPCTASARPHDDVGDAGLVLEREEHESLGRPRPLTRDHHPRHAHDPPLPRAAQVDGAQNPAHREFLAPERHRMPPNGQPGARVICDEALGFGHGF